MAFHDESHPPPEPDHNLLCQGRGKASIGALSRRLQKYGNESLLTAKPQRSQRRFFLHWRERPPEQKINPLCSLRLCGENVVEFMKRSTKPDHQERSQQKHFGVPICLNTPCGLFKFFLGSGQRDENSVPYLASLKPSFRRKRPGGCQPPAPSAEPLDAPDSRSKQGIAPLQDACAPAPLG